MQSILSFILNIDCRLSQRIGMSWLAELAGKAESLLEKVDKSAANALQVEKGVGSEPSSSNVKELGRAAPESVAAKNYGSNSDFTVTGVPKSNVNVTHGKCWSVPHWCH